MNHFTILSFFIAVLSSHHSGAQGNYYVEDVNTFRGALVAGGNFTQVDGDNYYGYKKAGLNLGGGVYAGIWENVFMAMEILYVQKGSRSRERLELNSTQGFDILKYDLRLSYAEVPVMIYYMDRHKHHFGAGVSYARLINSSEKSETDPLQNINTENYPFRKMDINLLLGGNLHLWKGLYAGARFQYSVVPVRTNPPPGFGRVEQYNNTLSIRLMWLFF